MPPVPILEHGSVAVGVVFDMMVGCALCFVRIALRRCVVEAVCSFAAYKVVVCSIVPRSPNIQ
jgi:hypothetical protein